MQTKSKKPETTINLDDLRSAQENLEDVLALAALDDPDSERTHAFELASLADDLLGSAVAVLETGDDSLPAQLTRARWLQRHAAADVQRLKKRIAAKGSN